jgi:hypothetical protein
MYYICIKNPSLCTAYVLKPTLHPLPSTLSLLPTTQFAQHTRMGALSGGQKVKVVLGAGLWNLPHIVILDEPTNFLDRDSLGALATAIKVGFDLYVYSPMPYVLCTICLFILSFDLIISLSYTLILSLSCCLVTPFSPSLLLSSSHPIGVQGRPLHDLTQRGVLRGPVP